MKPPAKHKHEKLRLQEVQSYKFFKSQSEKSFDNLTSFVAEYFNVDACGISIVSEESVYSKYSVGMDTPDFDRDYSICGHTILEEHQPLVIKDLLEDIRFHDNPLLTAPSNMRFYAACSIITDSNLPIGTFCIMNKSPRTLSEKNLEILQFFAGKCMELIKLRKSDLLLNLDQDYGLLYDTKNVLSANLLSHKIVNLNKSLPQKTSQTNREFNSNQVIENTNSEIKLLNQYLNLKKVERKTKIAIKSLLESNFKSNHRLKSLVTLDKDEEVLCEQKTLELALLWVLEFTARKNKHQEIIVSGIKTENQTVIIINSDRGGFDKQEQNGLFTLNLENPNASSCKGMEIPLAEKIIRLHSGTIQIYSAENAGLSFFISLPNS